MMSDMVQRASVRYITTDVMAMIGMRLTRSLIMGFSLVNVRTMFEQTKPAVMVAVCRGAFSGVNGAAA